VGGDVENCAAVDGFTNEEEEEEEVRGRGGDVIE
jgi:hypothetical protein